MAWARMLWPHQCYRSGSSNALTLRQQILVVVALRFLSTPKLKVGLKRLWTPDSIRVNYVDMASADVLLRLLLALLTVLGSSTIETLCLATRSLF